MNVHGFMYLFRNKISKLYSYFSLFSLILCNSLLCFIEFISDFNPVFYIDMLSLFAVGSPLFIFGIYTFSWEFVYFYLFLKDTNILTKFVSKIIDFYIIVSIVVSLITSIFLYLFFGLNAVYPIIMAFLYIFIIGNVITIFITSYDVVLIDFFNDKFLIINQPSLHFLILIANIGMFSSFKFALRFFEESFVGFLVIFLCSLIFWFIAKPLILKRIVNNLKCKTYAYPR
jgi:hypothetical protein